MKIAFVGKGGSGKSTVGALFTKYLIEQKHPVLAIDADINQHFAELLGAPFRAELALSAEGNPLAVREQLIGTNARIESPKKFVKTTPPGTGSHLVRIDDKDPLITKFATSFADNGYFMHVGTYDEDGIGTSCYHTNLSVFENIVSHTEPRDNQWLVADMVAGTDAFAGALYLLFDAIFMVVEPTPESVGVFKQFKQLAEKAGTFDRVFVVGNKVLDEDDHDYLVDAVGDKLVAEIGHDNQLRKDRQRGKAIENISPAVAEQLAKVEQAAITHKPDDADTLRLLHDLHARHAAEDYIVARHGDISGQIDPTFSYHA